MKTSGVGAFVSSILMLAISASAQNQPAQTTVPESAWHISEKGPHHSIWERIEYETGPNGVRSPRVLRYKELATGLNYQDEQTGEWLESKEEIELLPNATGASASKGQHKVIFPSDILGSPVELMFPNRKWLRSQVIGLAYWDRATGRSVLIAELKSSVGEVHQPNVVIYPNCFDGDGFTASLRYTYTRAGFEQDVILATRPPGPEEYGLNPETSVLQVLTEFVDPPQPRKEIGQLKTLRGDVVPDESLHFDSMMIGRGKAFSQDQSRNEIPVAKEWLLEGGRQVLVEEVLVPDVKLELEKLPSLESAGVKRSSAVRRTASIHRELPRRKLASAQKREMKLAMNSAPIAGLVLDYITLNSTLTNYTFAANECHYLTGPVYLYTSGAGTTIFEGNATVKYAPNVAAKLVFYGPVDFQTETYRPIVFTARDDRSVGYNYDFGSGNPSGYYAETALVFNYAGPVNLRNVRVSYAQTAVSFLQNYGNTARHLQIRNCDNGLSVGGGIALDVGNALFAAVNKPFIGGNGSSIKAAHITTDQSSSLVYDNSSGGASFAFTNSLFVYSTNLLGSPVGSIAGANNAFLGTTNFGVGTIALSGSPFQTAWQGYHYLNSSSGLGNTGTTNIPADLANDLRTLTIAAPIVYTNVTISAPTTFSPQAQRDTDAPDCGYHYFPLDYVFGGCTAGSNVTFTAGTSVGWFGTTSGWNHAGHGIHIADYQTVQFDGTASSPTYWLRYNAAQESRNGAYVSYGPGGITGWASTVAAAPQFKARFLRSSMLAAEHIAHARDDWGTLCYRISHSEFYSGTVGGYISSCYYTNVLFYRTFVYGMDGGWAGTEFAARNCTVYRERLFLRANYAVPISVRDSAFDGSTYIIENYAANATYANYSNNAYTNATNPFPIATSNDKQSVTFNWQTLPQGRFFLPTNSVLIDAGSQTAGAATLYHFTTQTNQVKEATSQVDIGYHYVAVDSRGYPLDLDGDGIPDYLEDANGNGAADAGETSWLVNNYNGLTSEGGLQVFTPLK
jgi:hypothetical protein